MTKINLPLLKEICESAGAPGHEQRIRKIVLREIKPLVNEIKVDNMGNVVGIKKGKDRKKVMVAAHMDEIGFMVTHIDKNGFLKFIPLGGFDPKTLTAQRVVVHGKKDIIGVMGSKPVHLMTPEERGKNVAIADYFIDLGLPFNEVQKIVRIGDTVTRERSLIELGHCLNCKSLDNRISVFILIETLKQLKSIPHDLYAAFTVQEEVGLRGAQAAALDIQPDFSFGLDTTIAFDTPGAKEHEMVTRLGDGAAIKVMDSSTICDYRMVAYMKEVATKNKIKWQPEILPAGGTDTASLQRFVAGGSIAGAVSIPTRHIHQVIESVHKEDVLNAVALLKASIENLNKYNWSF